MVINDGTGIGYKAKVNADFQLETSSIMATEEAFISENYGRSYLFSTFVQKLSSTNEHHALYFRNDSQIYDVRFNKISFSWNGGDTNHNRAVKWSWFQAPNEPTANSESIIPTNLNFKTTRIADVTILKWDGVGEGMTVTSPVRVGEELLGQGTTTNDASGVPVIGLNNAILVSFDGEEIGDYSLTIRFYMKEAVGV